ncbi:THAP domain-containing protein 5-like [Uloborus diversus]|uniref:THAP domain-containing protein 5-like n=1 Tax=Uloborus diversus TaxID=327109 RepID=UPI0024093A82|nr:THAP domain-containing protein 5-like [Uloborus diversus]
MPNTCCVPKCKGNYNQENRVVVFSFPKNEELLQKWMKAIPRENLVVTKNTRVCEKHFQNDDIERHTSFYKESSGETLTAKLKKPRLKYGAIPSIFPNCPKYLSSVKNIRDDPIKKKRYLEEKHINKALEDSLRSKEDFDKRFAFSNFNEMKKCFQLNEVPSFWSIIEKDQNLIFLAIQN